MSTSASLSLKGWDTKLTTVKWSILHSQLVLIEFERCLNIPSLTSNTQTIYKALEKKQKKKKNRKIEYKGFESKINMHIRHFEKVCSVKTKSTISV